MTNRFPSIFRASNNPPEFPLSNFFEDDFSGDEQCPYCNEPYSEHTMRQLVRCGLYSVRGEKKVGHDTSPT